MPAACPRGNDLCGGPNDILFEMHSDVDPRNTINSLRVLSHPPWLFFRLRNVWVLHSDRQDGMQKIQRKKEPSSTRASQQDTMYILNVGVVHAVLKACDILTNSLNKTSPADFRKVLRLIVFHLSSTMCLEQGKSEFSLTGSSRRFS